jgi:hypothetical protein
MMKAFAFMAVASLAGSAIASEDESVQLKVYVDGMTCPTGCAPRVAKGLSGLQGAQDVKLADFDAGLFTMAMDPKTGISPNAFQKSLGDYKVKKIEATLTGTVALKGKELLLTTASGQTYLLSVGMDKVCCADEKADAAKDGAAKKVEAAPKKEACDLCPATAGLKAKVDALAKDGRLAKVTGTVNECCEVSITVTAIDAVDTKKAQN